MAVSSYLLVALVVFMFVPLLYSFAMFDRLVRHEFEIHRASWDSDGKPCGFFWRAPEVNLIASSWARGSVSLDWFLSTPAWATQDTRCCRWLLHMRLSLIGFFILIPVVLGLISLSV